MSPLEYAPRPQRMKASAGRRRRSRWRVARLAVLAPMVLAWVVLAPGFSRPLAAAGDPVIAAAGDIACDPLASNFNGSSPKVCQQKATANELVAGNFAAVLSLGDNQYYCGSLAAYDQSYDPSWGRVKAITHPVVGNHEYLTHGGSGASTGCDATNANAAGYFSYFGSAAGAQGQGYYSFDVGAWHLIALNTNCGSAGGCGATSPQGKWLAADLAAHPNQCTLAYWHIPLFSSGGRANNNSKTFWTLLYAAHADVILDGHDHIYERFAPQTPAGVADPTNGILEITVGTGGADHTSIPAVAANSVVRDTTTFGILAMTLHPGQLQLVIPAGRGLVHGQRLGHLPQHRTRADADANPDAHANADPDPDADPDRLAHANPDRLAHANPDRLAHANPDRLAHANPDRLAHANPDRLAHADPDRLADADRLADPDADGLADADRLADPDADAHGLADADRLADADAHGLADADAHGLADPDAHGLADADAHGLADADAHSGPGPDAHSHADPDSGPHADPGPDADADPGNDRDRSCGR